MEVLQELRLALKIYQDNKRKGDKAVMSIFKDNNITLHQDSTNTSSL